MNASNPFLSGTKRWLLSLALAALLVLPLAAPALADGNSGTIATPVVGQTAAPGSTAGQAAAVPAVATQLKLDLAASGARIAQATATLTDATGKARTNVPVTFIRKTTFGQLALDTVNTDFGGQASVTLPTYPGQRIQVTAQFAGAPGLAPSQAQATMSLPAQPAPTHLGFYSQLPNPWFVLVLVIVIGGVWTTYGVAFHTVRKIRRAGEMGPSAAKAAAGH